MSSCYPNRELSELIVDYSCCRRELVQKLSGATIWNFNTIHHECMQVFLESLSFYLMQTNPAALGRYGGAVWLELRRKNQRLRTSCHFSSAGIRGINSAVPRAWCSCWPLLDRISFGKRAGGVGSRFLPSSQSQTAGVSLLLQRRGLFFCER